MRKFVRTYSPFLVYFVCVALAYFLCFYLFVSIGTLISFFIGEIVEYINNKSNS